MDLLDKIVFITWWTSWIWKAIAKDMIDNWAFVIISWRNEIKWINAQNELWNKSFFVQMDVRKYSQVKEVVDELINKFWKIDILVNNAWILKNNLLIKKSKDTNKFLPKLSIKDFDDVIDTNLKWVFYTTREVASHMANSNWWVIINTSSITWEDWSFWQTNYVASKFWVIWMTKVWARELANFNIRVVCVAPWVTDTNMIKDIPEKSKNDLVNKTPLKKIWKVDEIAKIYTFLASNKASFITWSTFRVDWWLNIWS